MVVVGQMQFVLLITELLNVHVLQLTMETQHMNVRLIQMNVPPIPVRTMPNVATQLVVLLATAILVVKAMHTTQAVSVRVIKLVRAPLLHAESTLNVVLSSTTRRNAIVPLLDQMGIQQLNASINDFNYISISILLIYLKYYCFYHF